MWLEDGTKSITLAVSLLALLLLPVLRIVVVEASAGGGLDPRSQLPSCSLRDPMMDPIFEVHYGHEVVWQIPPDPKGVLLFGHGHGMTGFEYFDPGPNCEQCCGMPETRTVVLEALRRRYAAIVVTGYGEGRTGVSAPIVDLIVKEWMAEHMLVSLPLAMWGHSQGASLGTALAGRLPMRAMVLMCGEGILELEKAATPLTFPPTLFAYMPVDQFYRENITGKAIAAMAALSSRGVQVAYTELWPKPLSPLFFTERILCVSEEMSLAIYSAYEAAGWIDSHGYLTRNPGEADWKSVLWAAKALPLCFSGDLCLAAHVKQELKMAFAEHSFTSEGNDVIFPWLDSTISSSFGGEEPILQFKHVNNPDALKLFVT